MSITLQSYSIDQLIGTYIRLREQRSTATRVYEAEDKEFADGLSAIADELLRRAQVENVDGFKSQHGTTYKKVSVKASIADDDAFYSWVEANKATSGFLERRVKAAAVANYIEEHGDAPPGLTVFKELTMQVRKPS